MIKLVDIHKIYSDGNTGFLALKNINLDFKDNEFVCILGKSGSGKTTLLNIIGGLDTASSGHMVIDGALTTKFTEVQWDQFRNYKIGFIFQNYSLIEHLTVIDNVMLSNSLQGVGHAESYAKALKMLKRVNLERHIDKLPGQLSGGERQRVSIARALVNDPEVILADEPTGSLDKKTAREILEIIKEISKEKLVIMVTHSKKIANEYANRIIELKDGEVVLDTNPQLIEKVKIIKPTKRTTSFRFFTKIKHALNNIRMKKWRTFLTALGLAIGVSGFILIDGLGNGVKINVNKQINAGELTPDLIFQIEKQKLTELNSDARTYLNKLTSDKDFKNVILDKGLYLDVYKISGEELTRNRNNSERLIYLQANQTKHYSNLVLDSKWPTSDNEIVLSGNFARSLYEIENLNKIWEKLKNQQIEIVVDYYFDLPYVTYYFNQFQDVCERYSFVSEQIEPVYYDEARFGPYSDQIKTQKNLFNQLLFEIGKENKSFIACENFQKLHLNLSNKIKSTKTYTIVGIMDSYISTSSVITENEYLQFEFGYLEYEQNIYYRYLIFLNDSVKGDEIFSIKMKYSSEAMVLDGYNDNLTIPIFDILIGIIQFIISLIMFISIITAGIMLLMVLLISVIERSREIGILRSLGATRSDILSIFLVESGVIGFIAGILGIVISVIVAITGNLLIQQFLKEELLSAFNETNINLIILRPVPSIISIFVCIFFACTFGFIPAIRASRKTPIEALKRL